MVRSFEKDEEISGMIEWTNDTITIKEHPYKSGEFGYNKPKYILIRKIEDGKIRYGWIEVKFESIYGIAGEIISFGIMQ